MIAHISHNHTTGDGVLFFELVFFLLHWKRVILARFGYFFSSLHTFCVFFTSLDIVIVNLNGQIWGMGLTMSNSLLYRDGITGLMKAITREENQVRDGTISSTAVWSSSLVSWQSDNDNEIAGGGDAACRPQDQHQPLQPSRWAHGSISSWHYSLNQPDNDLLLQTIFCP